jgi:galactokinase/mevalonate kinase-like predicted kinase
MDRIAVAVPARINIVGSPTDAVEGAYATISCAVPLRGGARLEPAAEWRFARDGSADAVRAPLGRLAYAGDGFDLPRAAINALAQHSPEFAAKSARRGATITTWTDIPASSGLAGSSVLVLAALAGLRALFDLDPRTHNDYVLAEIAQRAEEMELGITCGFADRYVPLFGGLAYLSYRGKLHHRALGEEPFVAYERLDARVPTLTFVVATTGVVRDSGDVHRPMRERYLRERAAGDGPMVEIARAIGATAWRGKIALLAGDLAAFGVQVDANHRLVDEMMRLCGFPAGAGAEANRLIAAARAAGASGAKLTGAGAGGAIFALASSGGAEPIASALRAAGAHEVFVLDVDATGAEVSRA